MERLFWICLGGAVGTAARYGIALWAATRFGDGFPIGTLLVNLVGCFAIALVMYPPRRRPAWPATLRMAITIGVLGGFTTYSSFNYETSRLLLEGASHHRRAQPAGDDGRRTRLWMAGPDLRAAADRTLMFTAESVEPAGSRVAPDLKVGSYG